MKKIFFITIISALSLAASAQSYKGSQRIQNAEEKLNQEYCTGMFRSADGIIFDIESNINVSSYFNILDWLQGRVAGLSVYTSRTGVSIPVIRGNVAGVFIDEIPVSLSYVNSLSTADIAMIKVIKSPFYGGFNGSGGAIAIYTFKVEEE